MDADAMAPWVTRASPVGISCPYLPWGTISITDVIAVSWKFNYIYFFNFVKNASRKELNNYWIQQVFVSLHLVISRAFPAATSRAYLSSYPVYHGPLHACTPKRDGYMDSRRDTGIHSAAWFYAAGSGVGLSVVACSPSERHGPWLPGPRSTAVGR